MHRMALKAPTILPFVFDPLRADVVEFARAALLELVAVVLGAIVEGRATLL